MRFTSFLNPVKVGKAIYFLAKCLRRRPFVVHSLREQSFVETALGLKLFFQGCLRDRGLLEHFLKTRENLAALNVEEGTMLYQDEHLLLQEAVQKSGSLPGPIVEIGTLFGFTTTRLALWKTPDKKIITVDNYSWNPWRLSQATHRRLTCRFLTYLIETGQVESIDMDKNAFYAGYKGERPALVFLDAIHTYEETRKDIEWAKQVGAWMIAGHDYSDGFPGVGQAVEEAGGVCAHAGGVWVLKNPYWEQHGNDVPLANCA